MKMNYSWRRQCVIKVWMLYFLHCYVDSQHSDPCLVNRNISTFDCKFPVCNIPHNSSTSDIIANITFPNKNVIPCNSSLTGDYADVTCPFEKANNVLAYIIKFLFRGCYNTLSLRPYTSVVPDQLHQVDITSPRGRKLLIQGSTDDSLIPSSSERIINITVYQQITDDNFIDVRQRSIIRSRPELLEAIGCLQPYTRYRIEITWRISISSLWSDLFVGYSMTVAARPTAAPQLLKGGYSYNEDKQLVFYWQAIDKSKMNGPELGYIIYKIPKNDPLLYDLVMNFSTVRDLYKMYINSSLDAVYNDSTTLLQQYYIKSLNGSKLSGLLYGFQEEDIFIIRANNSFSPSTYYSAFKIHNGSNVRNPISSFYVDQKNSTHHKLRWNFIELFIDHIDYLHIYYCYGYQWKLESWTECKDTIYNVTVEFLPADMYDEIFTTNAVTTYSLILKVETDNSTTCSGCALHFGISTETRHVSAPIFWNETEVFLQVTKPDEQSPDKTTIIIIAITSIISFAIVVFALYIAISRCRDFWKKTYVIDQLTNIETTSRNADFSLRNYIESEEDRNLNESLRNTQISSYTKVTVDPSIDFKGVDEVITKNKNIKSESKIYGAPIQSNGTVPASSESRNYENTNDSNHCELKRDKPQEQNNDESNVSIEMDELVSSESEPESKIDSSGKYNIIVYDNDDYSNQLL